MGSTVRAASHDRSTRSKRSVGRGLIGLGVVLLLFANLAPRVDAAGPGGGNGECDSVLPGSFLVAKFQNNDGGTYTLDEGTPGVVTLSNTTNSGGDWTSTVPISAVIVKGGPANDGGTIYDPPVTSGSFSNAGLPPVGGGSTPNISHVTFCALPEQPTTTTTEATTSSSEPTTSSSEPTTTSSEPTTTSSEPTTTSSEPTTTSSEPTTTTTEATTSTTEATTSTSEATTSTSEATTSSTDPTTTSTAPEGLGSTTTTTIPTEVLGESLGQVPPSSLPVTGGSSGWLAGLGAALILAGGLLLGVRRLVPAR